MHNMCPLCMMPNLLGVEYSMIHYNERQIKYTKPFDDEAVKNRPELDQNFSGVLCTP